MNRDEIKNALKNFLEAVENKNAEINVMLVDQNNRRKKPYKGLMLKTAIEDIMGVLKQSLNYLLNEIDRRTIDNYDLEISMDESIQIVEKTNVIHGDEIIDELSVEYSNSNIVTDSTDLSRIKFMVIQIFTDDKSLYLFKKYIQPTTAYRTTQKYILSGGLLKPFAEEIITISSVVEAFLLDEYYFVLNRNSFNSIFAYKDVYKKILDDNSQTIKDSGLMTESEQFITDCEADGRYMTRLTKAILAKGFEEVAKKKSGIPTVIKDFKLSLKISGSGEIIYEGKKDIPEILNLLLRHYVIDALTSNRMIAAAIQEYQTGA